MVEDGAFSHKTDCVNIIQEIPNRIQIAILLNWWILPVGWASAVEGLRSTGQHCLENVAILNIQDNISSSSLFRHTMTVQAISGYGNIV